MNNTPKQFFENLDGLRFTSFFFVFLTHLFSTCYSVFSPNELQIMHQIKIFSLGDLGVNFFFVLSGFLITHLLLEEKKNKNKINIAHFYVRRILRIWPLYYAILIFGFFIFPLLKSKLGLPSNDLSSPLPCFIFLNNFHKISHPNAGLIINILWSVGIEEQFYLSWPWFISKIKQNWMFIVICAFILVSLLFRSFFYSKTDINNHTLGVLLELVIGGLLAFIIQTNISVKERFKSLSLLVIVSIYAIIIYLILFHQILFNNQLLYILKPFIFSLLFGFIILEQNYSSNSFFKCSHFTTITKLGKYTYGMYCLHPIAILFCMNFIEKLSFSISGFYIFLTISLASFFITIIISYLSYTFFELRFLKLKSKFQ